MDQEVHTDDAFKAWMRVYRSQSGCTGVLVIITSEGNVPTDLISSHAAPLPK